MATLIRVNDMRDYRQILDRIMTEGEYSSPRGIKTLDLGYTAIHFRHPRHMLATHSGRMLNTKIAAVEAIQLIGGFHDPDLMTWASPNFKKYMNDGMFWGAYGERIQRQMVSVARKLTEDPSTRQAVVTLWNPELDNIPSKSDYPCTISLGYRIRERQLDAWTFMRSNDAWLGLPYDVFQFTQLQRSLARSLGVSPGEYTHTAASLHLYESDLDNVVNIKTNFMPAWEPDGIGDTLETIPTVMQRARMIGAWPGDLKEELMTESEKWYVRILDEFHESVRPDVQKGDLG